MKTIEILENIFVPLSGGLNCRKEVFFMLMDMLVKEFIFDCQVRELSPRTVKNYQNQLTYFLRFLNERFGVIELEQVVPLHIKEYIAMLQKKGSKPSYTNDLLKAVKCLFAYAHREGYTAELVTVVVKHFCNTTT